MIWVEFPWIQFLWAEPLRAGLTRGVCCSLTVDQPFVESMYTLFHGAISLKSE